MSKRKTQVRAGDSPAGYRPIHLPVSLRRLPGLILPLGFLIMAGFWSDMIFRTFSASARQMTLLALLVFIGWPAGMAGTCGQIENNISAGVRTNPGVGQTIWQHLPFLVLPVLAGLKLGWTGLAASLLLLTIHFWSTGLGKASTIITHRPAIGSLIQSTAYAIGILMPPVLLGLRGLFH